MATKRKAARGKRPPCPVLRIYMDDTYKTNEALLNTSLRYLGSFYDCHDKNKTYWQDYNDKLTSFHLAIGWRAVFYVDVDYRYPCFASPDNVPNDSPGIPCNDKISSIRLFERVGSQWVEVPDPRPTKAMDWLTDQVRQSKDHKAKLKKYRESKPKTTTKK